jgi:hypothetical protein
MLDIPEADTDNINILLAEDKFNCIRFCIPYAHFHHDYRDQFYFDLGGKVARHLEWHLYDEQRDINLV